MGKRKQHPYPHSKCHGTLPRWFAYSLLGLIVFIVAIAVLQELI